MNTLTNNAVAESLLSCLKQSRKITEPFCYWLLEGALPEADVDGLAGLPITPAEGVVFSGRRETHNSSRMFFDVKVQEKYPVCRRVVDGFKDESFRCSCSISRSCSTKPFTFRHTASARFAAATISCHHLAYLSALEKLNCAWPRLTRPAAPGAMAHTCATTMPAANATPPPRAKRLCRWCSLSAAGSRWLAPT